MIYGISRTTKHREKVLGMNEILDRCAQGVLKPTHLGPSLVVQWLRLHLPMQRVWAGPLVRELRSLTARGQKPKI